MLYFFLLFEFGNPRGKTVYKQGTTSQQCWVQSQKSSVSRKAINTLLTSSSFQRSGPMGEKLTGFVRLKYSLVRKWSWDLWYRVVNLLRIYCRGFLCCSHFDKKQLYFYDELGRIHTANIRRMFASLCCFLKTSSSCRWVDHEII